MARISDLIVNIRIVLDDRITKLLESQTRYCLEPNWTATKYHGTHWVLYHQSTEIHYKIASQKRLPNAYGQMVLYESFVELWNDFICNRDTWLRELGQPIPEEES